MKSISLTVGLLCVLFLSTTEAFAKSAEAFNKRFQVIRSDDGKLVGIRDRTLPVKFSVAPYIASNTDFAGKDYFTTSIGAGLRFYATDWLALDLSMRGHSFEHELFGESKRVINLESRLGLSLFF